MSMATVSPFANVVIDDVIVRTQKREIMKNKRGEIDVKGLAVFIVFWWWWWWFSLDRQSFPHSILLRDTIRWKGSRLSRHGFTRANRPVNPMEKKRQGAQTQTDKRLRAFALIFS